MPVLNFCGSSSSCWLFFYDIDTPSFTVYFAARAKERKNELKLEEAEQKVDQSMLPTDEAN